MKVIYGLTKIPVIPHGSIVTIGVFDGIHRGHRRIIREAVRRARAQRLKSVVVTFDPHPATVLRHARPVPSIVSLAHRIRLIKELGVDMVVVIKFTRAFARTEAETFLRSVVAGRLRGREIIASDKFFFGKDRSGFARRLPEFAARCGMRGRVIASVRVDGSPIGSSRVRQYIVSGDLKRAARLLGRPVSILGTVVSGSRFGRVLGYPTANLNPHHEVVPPSGVYAITALVGERTYGGLLNIGTRPTFFSSRDSEPQIEAHLFDFTGNIYGTDIEVFFIKKIRDEVKFKNSQCLIAQIKKDEERALKYFTS